ncbi:pyridoxamine 5'-phosphate oxidase family protein [Pseudonocardia sp. MH-G8]|uniref:pyridoxamine 5'-phosphate oxidase family protein n=1 Tax=Pseudonocardia sp. MH-G8 TaxID=1854588 RepID=UPI000B9FD96D|nr:pyridoxamine 5'-phosphate oxidase family protein [Pseudonocardia sp. MH-G8]OZM82747.1 pyridoxamine 5'-phosphate oxidase [Pseudonocardia sp. MH-G8]
MPLSKHDREQFLAEPHVAALSVAAGPERGPLTVPIWYQYSPGGELWFHTPVGSRKARLIDAAGRVSLMVDVADERICYVSVEGPVVRTEPGTDEVVREMSARYLPAERVASYVEFALAEHGEQVVYVVRPERWLSADLTS